MIPELTTRQNEFESAISAVRELVSGLTDETFNRRPVENRWSIAECIDHLVTTGRCMLPRMNGAVSDARAMGWLAEPPFRYGWLGNWFARAMGDDRLPPRNRLRAPRLYQPRSWANPTIGGAVQEFAALQDDFIAIVQAADGLDLARIKIASPVTRLLRLSLGQWLKGLSGHQRRHIWQAAQVKKELPD